MNYNWYNVINKTDFEALGLPSKEVTVNLVGIGEKTILVTKGELVSLTYEGVLLSANLNNKNPFAFEGYAIYLDLNNNIWLGVETA
jgi:hypothetical protein